MSTLRRATFGPTVSRAIKYAEQFEEHLQQIALSSPDSAGQWIYRASREHDLQHVIVVENMFSGRLCRELRMGGSAECGFSPWSGEWFRLIRKDLTGGKSEAV